MKKNNFFTLVICSYKRETLIKKCLTNVLKNTLKPKKIIIIDQNDNDKTNKISKQLFLKFKYSKFKIIKNIKNIGLTKSKNISLNYINTKYVVFLDDDIMTHKNFFKNLVDLIYIKKANGVCGVITNLKKSKIKNFFYYLTNFGPYKDNRYYFQNYKKYKNKKLYYSKINSLPGGITCFNTNIFKKLKFDEKYVVHNYEDVDFSIRLKKIIPNYKFFVSFKALCTDALEKKQKENISSRFKFMYLLFLKNKSFYFLIIFILSFIGLLFSNLKNLNFSIIRDFYIILLSQKIR
tara:strand:+ start:73 stop:948 length:876 start_codon:yes stop_codon:yes gene_type:complete